MKTRICKKCGIDFIGYCNEKYCNSCKRERLNELARKYYKTEKYKKRLKKYYNTEVYKNKHKKIIKTGFCLKCGVKVDNWYNSTKYCDSCKIIVSRESRKRFRENPKNRKKIIEDRKKYESTEKYKEKKKIYNSSENTKMAKLKYYYSNKYKVIEYKKQYRIQNYDHVKLLESKYRNNINNKIKRSNWSKNRVNNLDDIYIINLIKQKTELTTDDIRQYPELIELKRTAILATRELNKLNK